MALWPLEWAAFVRLQSAVGAVKIHLGPYTTWTENTIRKAKGGKKKGARGSRGGEAQAAVEGLVQPPEEPQEQRHIEDAPWNTKRNRGLIVISGQTAKSTGALQWIVPALTATAAPSPFPLGPARREQLGDGNWQPPLPTTLAPSLARWRPGLALLCGR